MTSEWTTGVHEGYRTKTLRVGNCTIEINRPISLTPEEQKKRENQIIEALKRFGKE